MDKEMLNLILWIIIWIFIWYMIAKLYFWIRLKSQRKDAVDRSKNIILWQVNEKIAPILPDFPYDINDLTFIWKWIDYLVFNWLHEWDLQEIIFLEIKTNKSNLNKNEKMIKDIINRWKIRYEIMKF